MENSVFRAPSEIGSNVWCFIDLRFPFLHGRMLERLGDGQLIHISGDDRGNWDQGFIMESNPPKAHSQGERWV